MDHIFTEYFFIYYINDFFVIRLANLCVHLFVEKYEIENSGVTFYYRPQDVFSLKYGNKITIINPNKIDKFL